MQWSHITEVSLYLFSNDISYGFESYGSDYSQNGSGTMIYMDLLSIYDDINLNDGVVTKYYDFIDIFNQTFGTSLTKLYRLLC